MSTPPSPYVVSQALMTEAPPPCDARDCEAGAALPGTPDKLTLITPASRPLLKSPGLAARKARARHAEEMALKKATAAALIGVGIAAVVIWSMRTAGPLPAVGLCLDAGLVLLCRRALYGTRRTRERGSPRLWRSGRRVTASPSETRGEREESGAEIAE